MRDEAAGRSVLVFGGSGTVGSELVRVLAAQGARVAFTFHRAAEKAQALAKETSSIALPIDLSQPANVPALFSRLDGQRFVPEVLIYAAARACRTPMDQVTLEEWNALEAVNCHSAWVACQEFVKRLGAPGSRPAQIILLSALDRTQTLPIPAAFAATQGKLGGLAMALAKELGPRGVCVNLVALGALESGMARELNPDRLGDFKSFSALRRLGQPREAARSVAWLASENTYMTGRVLAVNGGI